MFCISNRLHCFLRPRVHPNLQTWHTMRSLKMGRPVTRASLVKGNERVIYQGLVTYSRDSQDMVVFFKAQASESEESAPESSGAQVVANDTLTAANCRDAFSDALSKTVDETCPKLTRMAFHPSSSQHYYPVKGQRKPRPFNSLPCHEFVNMFPLGSLP